MLFDLNKEYSANFANYVQQSYNGKIDIAASLEQGCKESDLIILATTAPQPYITSLEWFKHNPTVLNISLRDLSSEIILNSVNIVDDVSHCLKASTSPHLAYLEVGHHNFIMGTIGGMLKDQSQKDFRSIKKPKVYSPFGMGILDIALGSFVYNEISSQGNGIVMKDFFYEQSRW